MRPRWQRAFVLLAVLAAVSGRAAGPERAEKPARSDPAAPVSPWQWNQNGQPVRDEPWRRSSGPFGAMLVVTDRPDEFLEAWAKPPSPDYRPAFHAVSEARRGETVAAMILFARCAADSDGRCRSDVAWRLLRPDGSTYAEQRGVPLWNEVAPPAKSLQVAEGVLHFEVELDDPLGKYQIEALVFDRVSNRQISLTRELRVVEAAAR